MVLLPHNITSMIAKLNDPDAGFDIPEHASHVTRTRHNLSVVDETAATQISGMSTQFASAFGAGAILVVQAVDGANVIETATGNEVPGW